VVSGHLDSAELGRFPLQVHFWQQILRHHHRTIALDNVHLGQLAVVDGVRQQSKTVFLIYWIQIHFPKDTVICRAW